MVLSMAKVWVQAVTVLHSMDENNKMRTYQPGDWLTVGKHQARIWLENGQAQTPDREKRDNIIYGELEDCGVLVRGDVSALDGLLDPKHGISVDSGDPSIPWNRTLIWNPTLDLLDNQLRYGFVRIEKPEGYDAWEIAVMLMDNRLLASEHGEEEEKQKTLAAVGDLRLPVYETRAMWIRQTEQAETVIKAWADELEKGADEAHAFLRAIFTNPIMICTLPHRWMHKWRPI